MKLQSDQKNYITDSQMNNAITEELNKHSQLVNANVKQNLVIQRQEFDGMIKRLGLNL